jgi:DNA-binding response OmpR family regulator
LVPDRILVIEDDPDVSDTVCTALEALFPGARVTTVSSGEEFRAIFDQDAVFAWNLVVLDLMLPRISGVEICQMIRRTRGGERVPILAVSGYDTAETADKISRAGATRYLAKPFEIPDFNQAIEEILT